MVKQPPSTDRAAVLKAKVFAKQGDYEKAIAELDRLIQGAPEGSVRRREAQLARAECLVGQKKYAEAEPLLLQGDGGRKQREAKVPPPFRAIRLKEALERLVRLYDAIGKKEEAARWQMKLDEAGKAAAPQPPRK
jgi:tetratricopeptide (TPR) repeat protein